MSSIALPLAQGAAVGARGPATTCSTPGATNYITNCHGTGNPVNETSIAAIYNGTTFVAGANDYNSWNGNSDFGYYTSPDGTTWTDNGPLDLFPHGSNTAAGDPGLGIDLAGVVYYSGIYFDYFDCSVGGVELARRNPANGSWSSYQIKGNTNNRFQDKPAIVQDEQHVFVGWTEYFGSFCVGFENRFPLRIAVFKDGPASRRPLAILRVPGSVYSAGISMASDERDGIYVTWEEFPSPTSLRGAIKFNRWQPGVGWGVTETISPPEFTDLPSPLPGFAFRVNSFPMVAYANDRPVVVWCSYDTGVGRAYWWQNGNIYPVYPFGDHQFFASVARRFNSNPAFSWSQTDQSNLSFDQYVQYGATRKVSTASSFPNSDPFFGGAFIGDYNALIYHDAGGPIPIWTDVRGPSFSQNAMVYSP
jgi:hypothetical protein